MRARRFAMATLLAAALASQGCNGGSVVVIQSGAPVSSAAPAAVAGTGQAGVSASASNWFAGAIVLLLVVANAINEAGRPAEAGGEGPTGQWRPLFQPIDRGWVDRGP